jgi:hypothetical protein
MESIRASHKNIGFAIHIWGYILIVLNFQHPQQEQLQQPRPPPQPRPPQPRPQQPHPQQRPRPQQRPHSRRSVFFIFILQFFKTGVPNLFGRPPRSILDPFWP